MLMAEFVGGLLWILSTGATVQCCFVLARRWYPGDSAWQMALHTAVLSVCVGIVSLTVVGACGLLSPATILLSPPAVALAVRRIRFPPALHNTASPEPVVTTWLWSGVAGLIVGHCVVNGILQFPTDYDCLMYHLPLIDSWLQSGSLATTQSQRWADSANSELLGLWFAGAFSGDFWVPLNNLPVMLVWVAGVLETGRRLGLAGWWPHLVAVASIAVYTTVHETDDASNDLMVAAFFVAGLAYALRYQASRTSSDRLLFALSLRVLAGTKFFATGYALLLGLTFVVLATSSRGLRRGVGDGLLCAGVSLLTGGYWYVRNLLLTGCVFFPKGSPVFREHIAHPNLAQTTLALNIDDRVPGLLMDAVWRLCGPIHFTLVMLLPTLLLALCIMGRKGWRCEQSLSGRACVLALLLVSTGLIAVMTPMLVEDQPDTLNHLRWAYTPVRYALCFLTILVLVAGFLLHNAFAMVSSRIRQPVVLLLVTGALMQFVVRFWSQPELDMNQAAIPGGVCVAAFYLLRVLWRRSAFSRIIVVAIVLLAVPFFAAQTSARWHAGYAQHFNVFYGTQWFQELEKSGSRIVVLDERSYPFFGSRREHFVLHDACYRGVDDVRQVLTRNNIQVVVTRIDTSAQKISRYRPAWDNLEASASFTEIASGRELRVFRVVANDVHFSGSISP